MADLVIGGETNFVLHAAVQDGALKAAISTAGHVVFAETVQLPPDPVPADFADALRVLADHISKHAYVIPVPFAERLASYSAEDQTTRQESSTSRSSSDDKPR